LDVVLAVCKLFDQLRPRADGEAYKTQIAMVADRPGHDRRYAIDITRTQRELGWRPSETFSSALEKTVRWYLENPQWVADIVSGVYRQADPAP
ncbi:MAG: GDP-mannose 4,6-dehydratase, partial [Pigmentiphaga sp.]